MENVSGKDNIVSAWQAGMAMFPFIFMSISVGFIRVDGDTATARCYTTEVGTTVDGTEIRPRGQYDDMLVKVGGQWFFKERIFNSLYGE